MRRTSFLEALALAGLVAACTPAKSPGLNAAQPLPDSDEDGIANLVDECPGAKEDGRPPLAKDGCPHDEDGDGVKGLADRCPEKAEVWNGFEDGDGCPDEAPKAAAPVKEEKKPERVSVTDREIKFDEEILFKTGSSEIDHASDKLIEDIARVFKEHGEIDFVEVAGHADKRGSDVNNRSLTQRRAEEVGRRLSSHGVDAQRMRAVGYGSYCPVDPGDSEAALAKNRRVELRILRRAGKDLDDKWGGCGGALAKGMKPQEIPATAPRSEAPKDALAGGRGKVDLKPAELPQPEQSDEEKRLSADCDGGKVASCTLLGLMAEAGNGAIKDEARATSLHRKACDGGDWDGCANLGSLVELQRGPREDVSRALAAYSTSCEHGNQEGCDGLGSLHQHGRGVVLDNTKALQLYRQACDGGVAPACEAAGMMKYRGEGAPENVDEAILLLERSCSWKYQKACAELRAVEARRAKPAAAPTDTPAPEAPPTPATATAACEIGALGPCTERCSQKEGSACWKLGVMYAYGVAVTAEHSRAVTLFTQAGEYGFPRGYTFLGLLTERGFGAKADAEASAGLYKKACDQGDAAGCTNLGILHAAGRGVAQDYSMALSLLSTGCANGDGNGCERLGQLYLDGKGTAAEPTRAAANFRLACERGVASACELDGEVNLKGQGVSEDRDRAITLFRRSCDGDYKLGCDKLADAKAKAAVQTKVAKGDFKVCAVGEVDECTRQCDAGVAAACDTLGITFTYGVRVGADLPRARVAFDTALRGGFLLGGVHLGLLLEGGLGGDADLGGAVKLYTQACDGRTWVGCTNSGILSLRGRGVARSEAEALAKFRLACANGDPLGCEWEGGLYARGIGVSVDLPRSLSLYKMACFGGSGTGCEAYGRLLLEGLGSIEVDRPSGKGAIELGCDRGSLGACRIKAELSTCRLGDPDDCIRLCDRGTTSACYAVGRLYLSGLSVPKDEGKAALYFRKAYDAAVSLSCPVDVK